MGRTPKAIVAPADDNFDPEKLEAADQAARQLAVYQGEQDALVRATAAKIGYLLPADATDPDLIQRDISANMRRSVEACLEMGRGLIVLKAACGHGNFLARLGVLGLDHSVAFRFMQAATKFSNIASTQYLTRAIGNQTKLFEMLVLDDEQIDELALTGQTGELHLDAVATMSVKELRTALRELRANSEAQGQVLDATQKKLTDLQVQTRKKIAVDTDWPDALAPITEQIAAAGRKMATALSELETCRITLFEVAQHIPEEGRPKYDAALGHVAEVYEEALLRAERTLQRERVTYDKTLGPYGPEAV
jgi:hypothetical protein